MIRYLTQKEIQKRCNDNSVIKEGFNTFIKKHPGLKYRITDLYSNTSFSKGNWICYIKYELNYKTYTEAVEVE